MCCRYVLLLDALRTLAARQGVDLPPELVSRYNIAPGSPIPVIRKKPRSPGAELALLPWGLVPAWTRGEPPAIPPVNARVETLASKPTFRDAFARRRCLIPASGFYEWQTAGRAKKPWLFRRRDDRPFCFAGLWEAWRAPDGTELETCAIITTDAGELMRPIHHRQPLILPDAVQNDWLDERLTRPDELAPLLQPFVSGEFSAQALDGHVNNVRHDDPACLTPAPADSAGPQLAFDL